MALAERAALGRAFDALLWLNDDVAARPGCGCALGRRSRRYRDRGRRYPRPLYRSHNLVGRADQGPAPAAGERVEPGSAAVAVDTFNGNAVPRAEARPRSRRVPRRRLRHIAAEFRLRSTRSPARIPRLLCAGMVGECEANPEPRPWAASASPATAIGGCSSAARAPLGSRARYLRRARRPRLAVYWPGAVHPGAARGAACGTRTTARGRRPHRRLTWTARRRERPGDLAVPVPLRGRAPGSPGTGRALSSSCSARSSTMITARRSTRMSSGLRHGQAAAGSRAS